MKPVRRSSVTLIVYEQTGPEEKDTAVALGVSAALARASVRVLVMCTWARSNNPFARHGCVFLNVSVFVSFINYIMCAGSSCSAPWHILVFSEQMEHHCSKKCWIFSCFGLKIQHFGSVHQYVSCLVSKGLNKTSFGHFRLFVLNYNQKL